MASFWGFIFSACHIKNIEQSFRFSELVSNIYIDSSIAHVAVDTGYPERLLSFLEIVAAQIRYTSTVN